MRYDLKDLFLVFVLFASALAVFGRAGIVIAAISLLVAVVIRFTEYHVRALSYFCRRFGKRNGKQVYSVE